MTPREAFKKVLAHEDVYPVPFTIKFTVEAKENWARHLGKKFDPILDTGSYVVASHTNNGWEEIKPNFFRDTFGVVWDKTHDKTLGLVERPPIQEPSLTGFHFPNANNLKVYGFIEDDKKRYPNHYHMVSIGFALFERAWALCGMENLFEWLIHEPDLCMIF